MCQTACIFGLSTVFFSKQKSYVQDSILVQITPHRTHACALFFSLSVTFHPLHIHWLQMCERFCECPKSSHPCTMSLVGVPEFSAFPPVLASSTTALTGIRLVPCATPLWVDRLAIWPIRLETHFSPPEGDPIQEKGPSSGYPRFEIGPPNLPKEPIRTEDWAQKRPIPSFGCGRRPRASAVRRTLFHRQSSKSLFNIS